MILKLLLYSFLTASIIITSFCTLAHAEKADASSLLEKGIKKMSEFAHEEAISYFDKVLELDPENLDALNNKGVALGNLQRYKEAISYFNKVLDLDPENISALNNKGATLIKLSNFVEAISYFDKVLELDPKNAVASSNKKVLLHRNYSQESKDDYKHRFFIFGQIEVRDSEDHLVAYIESNRVEIPDPDLLEIFADTTTVGKSNITKNGQQFEQLIIKNSGIFSGEETSASITGILWGQKWILYVVHDGYPVIEGDKTLQTWTILRRL